MLVDAAKQGDVEIPVFCYEPKLGAPVGACRMCLVEIEGIPKLQTACSTPVRDGMVVYTQTDQVKEAQSAVVEFLLVNHPLDCPVCDKGGECPLQDIAMGWGPGKSRFTDPKRHFEKPIPLSPADRDRPRALHPLLPLRPLQPGGRRGRAAAAPRARRPLLRRHLRRPPLRRPLPRQHHRALPGRGADLLHLPLPRPALGHRAGGLGLHPLPEPVQRQLHRPRRAGHAGARPRQPRGRRRLALRQGPLRLRDARPPRRGSPRRRSAPAAAPARRAGRRRSSGRPPGCAAPGASAAAIVGDASNEEGYLVQRIAPRRRSAPRTSTRGSRRGPDREALLAALARPSSRARVADIDDAGAILVVGTDPLHAAPILDLRIRKAVRRNGASALRRHASGRPRSTAAPRQSARYAPGGVAGFLGELNGAIARGAIRGRGSIADALRGAETVVDRLGRADRPRRRRPGGDRRAARPRRRDSASPAGRRCGLLEVPDVTNARGLREVGCLPDAGPGLAEARSRAQSTDEIRDGARVAASSTAILLFGVDPLRDFPDSAGWQRALAAADFTVAFSHVRATRRPPQADVVFPLETPRREGGHRHPPRRPPAARPPLRPPPRRRPPGLAGAGRAVGRTRATRPASRRRPTRSPPSPTRSRSTPDSRTRRSAGAGVRWQDRPAAASPAGGQARGAGVWRGGRYALSESTVFRRRGTGRLHHGNGTPASAPTGTSGPVR